ncbi:MAG: hypothetical protein HRU12_08345 [Phaeodactylibacter sp.]|nr:hypothetical protein [Phaeodactylibacter sp.]
MPYRLEADDTGQSITGFDGFVELSTAVLNRESCRIEASIKKSDGLNTVFERLAAIDFAFLEEKGAIGNSDYLTIEYVVEQPFNLIDQVILFGQVYALTATFIDNLFKIQKAAADFAGHLAGGVSGSAGAAIFAALQLVALIAYQASILAQIIALGNQVVNTYLQPRRQAKTASLRTLIDKMFGFYGYTVETTLPLDRYYYLPSNTNYDRPNFEGFIGVTGGPTRGYPSISDRGYNCFELLQIVKDLFKTHEAVVNGVVQIHNVESSYWRRTSTFKLVDILSQAYRINSDEAVANTSFTFQADYQEDFTLSEFVGSAALASLEYAGNGQIKGNKRIDIPLALGSRKDDLTAFERVLKSFLETVDTIADVFGKNPRLSNRVSDKVGLLRVSNNNYSVPKLLYLSGGKLPQDHRSKSSAKFFYDTYHKSSSFAAYQKQIFEGVKVPMRLDDFNKILDNSFFTTHDGKEGRILKVDWTTNQDFANIDYYIEGQFVTGLSESTKEIS